MAERRMFAKTIIDSDAFIDMSLSTQALYFHLSRRADDDGFINNPKKIQRMIGASDDDLKVLIIKKFIIPFESGIVVIKHWKIHNYIRNDRYKETIYLEEKSMLETKQNNGYILKNKVGIPNGYQMDTQDRIEIVKNSIEIEQDNRDKIIDIDNCASVSVSEAELLDFFENFEIKDFASQNEIIKYLNYGMSFEVIKNGMSIPFDRNAMNFDFETETAPIDNPIAYGLRILENWYNMGAKTMTEVKRYNKLNRNRTNMLGSDKNI